MDNSSNLFCSETHVGMGRQRRERCVDCRPLPAPDELYSCAVPGTVAPTRIKTTKLPLATQSYKSADMAPTPRMIKLTPSSRSRVGEHVSIFAFYRGSLSNEITPQPQP
ncbi:hypothetical protein NDU88_002482 [Pleurodeles waltl]|uniref:Uncharacterized protein n=1 Tax=Pleurodeles waltl TaxID=8319 RepID=A0AAV7SCK6_PLEWA|nr:hypothetical protein NDU88_002482 [Pleurodeles waltl]